MSDKEYVKDLTSEKVLLGGKEFTLQEVVTCLSVLQSMKKEVQELDQTRLERERTHERAAVASMINMVQQDALIVYGYSWIFDSGGNIKPFYYDNDFLPALRRVHYQHKADDGVFNKYGSTRKERDNES